MTKQIAPEALTRAQLNKDIVTKLKELARKIGVKELSDDHLTSLFGGDVLNDLFRDISIQELESFAGSSNLIEALVIRSNDTAALNFKMLIETLDAERLEDVAKGVADSIERRKKISKKYADDAKKGAKATLGTKEVYLPLTELDTLVGEINKSSEEISDVLGNLYRPMPLYLRDGADIEGERSRVLQLTREIAEVLAVKSTHKLSEEHTAMLDRHYLVLTTALDKILNSDEQYSGIVGTKSGIMTAPIMTGKPRPKFVPATLEDTEEGLVVSFPKPLTLKYGVPQIINLGVIINDQSVFFDSDLFDCIALRTTRLLGTMMMVIPKSVDTIKLEADAKLGNLVLKQMKVSSFGF